MKYDIRKRFLKEEYISRVNRVIDYIELNLDKELKLEIIARVANFSPFHFHRLFTAFTGESLSKFIQRLRIEKAAVQLIVNPKKNITNIAYNCGFGSSASFSRAFRDHFFTSPKEWRNSVISGNSKKYKIKSKISKTKSNFGKDHDVSHDYIISKSQNTIRRNIMKPGQASINALKVEVKEVPDMHVAYVRYIGPIIGNDSQFKKLFSKIFKWAKARDLCKPGIKVLCIYHDDPDITDTDRFRTSVGLTVPENTEVSGEIGKMMIPGGKFAIARFKLAKDEYKIAWKSLYSEWLPESGYQPDDRPCFEDYLSNPEDDPEHKALVDICIPVIPF
ncbi:MAG: AraC family transcriptional regulator [Spirochaetes bacterium]|nr:AraC family transcriptional regulator [Spirochaetota bacterium]